MERPVLSPLTRLGIFLLLAGVAIIFGLLGVLKWLPAGKPGQQTMPANAAGQRGGASSRPTNALVVQGPTVEELGRSIAAALAVLNDPNNPNKAQALAALRSALAGADPKVALAAIRQFLQTGQDGKTGLRFKVGEGGVLAEAPTLRTFLLDQLGTLSTEAKTSDAADVAQEILGSKTSADEWALALRNIAWADPNGSKTLLAAKAREMIGYQPWQQNPSGGYLEAFDVAAYSGDASLVGDLAPLAKTATPLQRAAEIALERLSALAPAQVSSYLNANPGVLADLPLLRADYMGNVDLSDPAQEAQAEAYLRRSDVTEAEKEKFLARLATPAGFVSNNLLTPPDIATTSIFAHRTTVNQAASSWLASGAFPALAVPLQTLVQNTAPKTGGG